MPIGPLTSRDCDRIAEGFEAILLNSASSRNGLRDFKVRRGMITQEEADDLREPEHAEELENRLIASALDEVNYRYPEIEEPTEEELYELEQKFRASEGKTRLTPSGSCGCTICESSRKAEVAVGQFVNGVYVGFLSEGQAEMMG